MDSILTDLLCQIVARSACVAIDHVHGTNKSGKVLSLWLEADRVLRCGMIWLYYLVHQSQGGQPEGDQSSMIGPADRMAPILQVTSLLSSFAARFKRASASLSAWEACTAFFWKMMPSSSTAL